MLHSFRRDFVVASLQGLSKSKDLPLVLNSSIPRFYPSVILAMNTGVIKGSISWLTIVTFLRAGKYFSTYTAYNCYGRIISVLRRPAVNLDLLMVNRLPSFFHADMTIVLMRVGILA